MYLRCQKVQNSDLLPTSDGVGLALRELFTKSRESFTVSKIPPRFLWGMSSTRAWKIKPHLWWHQLISHDMLKIHLKFYPSWHLLNLLTFERTGCGASLGVDWWVPIIGINLDSGIGFLGGGDTADMPKLPVCKDISENKYNQTEYCLNNPRYFTVKNNYVFQTWYEAVLTQQVVLHHESILFISESKNNMTDYIK